MKYPFGNRVVVKEGDVTPPSPPLSTADFSGQIFKDDVKGFSSCSQGTWFMFLSH
jgi:hypothetical protein